MGKNNRADPIEQFVRYARIISWVSIAVALLGTGYLVYSILAFK